MKKIIACIVVFAFLLSTMSAFAMSTYDFDNGMEKGISYFNRGMYYEARDEFQWFCDYNWGDMNQGQQQYALDYLDGTKAEIQRWGNQVRNSRKITVMYNDCGFSMEAFETVVEQLRVPATRNVDVYATDWYWEGAGRYVVLVDVYDSATKKLIAFCEGVDYNGNIMKGIWLYSPENDYR